MNTTHPHFEAYPNHIQNRLNNFNNRVKKALPPYIGGNTAMLVIEDLKLWRIGTLKVSFKGGNSNLHKVISETAKIWEQYGNISFDFGYNNNNNTYRNWSPNDDSHIRVGFEYPGYWSLLGNDSMNSHIISNNEISLNLAGFDTQLPNDHESTILHEFGHALGFHHEHQGPVQCAFDMDLLYDYLGGPPNNWTKTQVDHNILQLDLSGMRYSAHDKHSIMHYSFPSWMFKHKENSPCFTSKNNKLSNEDRVMMLEAYPFDFNLITKKDSLRIDQLNSILSITRIEDHLKENIKEHFSYYNQFLK